MNISMSWARKSGSAVIAAALLLTVMAAVPAKAGSESGAITSVAAESFNLGTQFYIRGNQTKYTLGGKSVTAPLVGHNAKVEYAMTGGTFNKKRYATLVAMSLNVVKGGADPVPTSSVRSKAVATPAGSGGQ